MASTVPRTGAEAVPIEVSGSAESSQIGVMLTHGAGGNMSSGNLPAYAEAFANAGITCVRLTYNPRRVPAGQKCMQAVLDHTAQAFPNIKQWVLAGQSMGGRVSCEVALANEDRVAGLLFFSYPLHPPGKQEQLRDAPLRKLQLPMLFIRGSRDPFCDVSKFEATLPSIPSKAVQVHVVEGGDHSLNVKGGKKPTAAAREKFIQAAIDYIGQLAPNRETPGDDKTVSSPPNKKAKRI